MKTPLKKKGAIDKYLNTYIIHYFPRKSAIIVEFSSQIIKFCSFFPKNTAVFAAFMSDNIPGNPQMSHSNGS